MMRITHPLETYNEDEIIEQARQAKVWLRKENDSPHVWLYTFIGEEADLTAFLVDCYGLELDDVGHLLRSLPT